MRRPGHKHCDERPLLDIEWIGSGKLIFTHRTISLEQFVQHFLKEDFWCFPNIWTTLQLMECKTPGPVLKSVGAGILYGATFSGTTQCGPERRFSGPHLTQCDCKWKKPNPNRKWGWLLFFPCGEIPSSPQYFITSVNHTSTPDKEVGGCLTCVKFVCHPIPILPFATLPCLPINLEKFIKHFNL